MANAYLTVPDLALDKFFGTDTDQDAESLIRLTELKVNFALGDAPGGFDDLAKYIFRKRDLFSFLPRGPVDEWNGNNITNATTWENGRTTFMIRFSDTRNKFRYRIEMERCIRGDGKKVGFSYAV